MIERLQEFTESLPPLLQWLGVTLAGAIPFIESYAGAVIGVIAGVHVLVAVSAAVIGWQVVSICLWGAAFGALATLGVDLVRT